MTEFSESDVQIGADLLTSMLTELPETIKAMEEHDDEFRQKIVDRWGTELSLMKMFISVSGEFGSLFNNRERDRAHAEHDLTFDAFVMLHARSIRVANEVLGLLREGFPDAALSRWRTLHELAVVATVLSQHGSEVSERFLLHRHIVNAKALRQYEEFQPRSNMAPLAAVSWKRR